MDSGLMGGQEINGKKDKILDSGGNQRQVEEINIFVPSKIDYTLAAGIDMCQRSLVAVPHQQLYGSTVKELHIRQTPAVPTFS